MTIKRPLLDHLERFVALQQSVIREMLATSPMIERDYQLRSCTTPQITVDGEVWKTRVHGAGVEFRRDVDGTVVDCHVGMLSHPTAFDLWRFCRYLRSISCKHDKPQLEAQLANLVKEKRLQPANDLAHHFELVTSSNQTD